MQLRLEETNVVLKTKNMDGGIASSADPEYSTAYPAATSNSDSSYNKPTATYSDEVKPLFGSLFMLRGFKWKQRLILFENSV